MSLAAVQERMAAAAERAGRKMDEVNLVVVSKGHSPAEIAELFGKGVADFGENRAQELAAKVALVPTGIRWHFVGPLQTNKVRLVRPAVVLLHSLDRLELGSAWVKGPGLPPPVLLQVNIGGEPQKHGIDPSEAGSLCGELARLGVTVAGLMTMPPIFEDPQQARPFFAGLALLRQRLSSDFPALQHLSMGMSDDFEVAIEEGATLIRVGRAIFA